MSIKRKIALSGLIVVLLCAILGLIACGDYIDITLNFGCYSQTVSIKRGSIASVKSISYLRGDWVEGLYFDEHFQNPYDNSPIKDVTVLYVCADENHTVEKEYEEDPEPNFDPASLSIIMNKGFSFDSLMQSLLKNAGVQIQSFHSGGLDINKRERVDLWLSNKGRDQVLIARAIIEKFPQIYHVRTTNGLFWDMASNDSRYGEQWGLSKINVQSVCYISLLALNEI